MLILRTAVVACIALALTTLADALSPLEQRIVGSWSWRYIEGFGRVVFTADHKVTEGFPPDDKDGRTISDKEFQILRAGTWRLEGDVLVTVMDNAPGRDLIRRLAPTEVPPFKKETRRQKIVSIDDKKMVFDDGGSLDRVRGSVR
jgi:hypothetical protein